jgi:hypothetical protein
MKPLLQWLIAVSDESPGVSDESANFANLHIPADEEHK